MIRAYRLLSGRRIAPFGDLARDLFVGVRTLAAHQEAAAIASGLEIKDIADLDLAVERPCVVFSDDVYFSALALRQFVRARKSAPDVRLAIADSATLRACRVLDDEPPLEDGAQAFDVFMVRSPGPLESLESLRARAKVEVLAMRERTARIRLPAHLKESGATAEYAITARVVGVVRHWVHLLRLSQLSIGVSIADALRRRPGLILKVGLFHRNDAWGAARALNFVHPTARVHPTADLEGAVIGPEATVEAHAHVHRSVLGRGVSIGDHSAVVGSTLAEGTQVLRASYIALSAAMPDTTLSSYKVQLSLFGREVFLTASAILIDAKLRGAVRVEHEGRLVSVGTPFLGACLGHRVTLGAGVAIEPGRAVPNGSTVVAPPGTFGAVLPSHPEGSILTIREGRLVPVDSPSLGPSIG